MTANLKAGANAPGANAPIFAFGSDAPADLLANSVYVCSFLGEVAGQFSDESGAGLSEEGAAGLSLVLGAVAETITCAMANMASNEKQH